MEKEENILQPNAVLGQWFSYIRMTFHNCNIILKYKLLSIQKQAILLHIRSKTV